MWIKHSLHNFPFWNLIRAVVAKKFLKLIKNKMPCDSIKQIFLDHKQTHNGSVSIYTDGSQDDWDRFCCKLNHVVRRYLHSLSSVYTAELKVLKRLEPIQNACPRAITGAFQSSPAVSFMRGNGNATTGFFLWYANTKKHFQNSKPAKLPYPTCSDRPTERPNSNNGAHQQTMHTIPGTNPQDIN